MIGYNHGDCPPIAERPAFLELRQPVPAVAFGDVWRMSVMNGQAEQV
jgi:hypothetical protein